MDNLMDKKRASALECGFDSVTTRHYTKAVMNSNTADVFDSLVDTLDKFSINGAASDKIVFYERMELELPYRARVYTSVDWFTTRSARYDRITEYINQIQNWIDYTYGPDYPHITVTRKPTGLKVCFAKESDRSLFALKWS